jgi:hypothetical protein
MVSFVRSAVGGSPGFSGLGYKGSSPLAVERAFVYGLSVRSCKSCGVG